MSWICNPFLMATSISLVNNMRSSMITITYTSINMDLKPWLVMSSVILIWQPLDWDLPTGLTPSWHKVSSLAYMYIYIYITRQEIIFHKTLALRRHSSLVKSCPIFLSKVADG
jgi:hypothetical protein